MDHKDCSPILMILIKLTTMKSLSPTSMADMIRTHIHAWIRGESGHEYGHVLPEEGPEIVATCWANTKEVPSGARFVNAGGRH